MPKKPSYYKVNDDNDDRKGEEVIIMSNSKDFILKKKEHWDYGMFLCLRINIENTIL